MVSGDKVYLIDEKNEVFVASICTFCYNVYGEKELKHVDVLDAVDVDGGAVLPAADAAAVAVEFAVAELIGRLLCAGVVNGCSFESWEVFIMTEMEKEKVLSAALCEAQSYRALELDGLSDGALKSHKMAFRTVMRLAVSLGIATQEDSERIWEKGRAAAEDLAAWKAEEHQRKAAEVRREKRKAARGGGEVR